MTTHPTTVTEGQKDMPTKMVPPPAKVPPPPPPPPPGKPTTVDTSPPVDANTHAIYVMAFRSVLNGNRDLARARVARLSDDQRDELMSAAAILVAITGGVSEEALVAEAALNPDGIGGLS